MNVRPFSEADWGRVCVIHDAARQDELTAAGLEDAFLTLEETADNERFYDYRVRVAESEGQVLGFVAFTEDELAWLYVDPNAYGRGIGTALIRAALAETGNAMTVEVLDSNAAALAVYQKAGFQITGREQGRMPGNERFSVSVTVLTHAGSN